MIAGEVGDRDDLKIRWPPNRATGEPHRGRLLNRPGQGRDLPVLEFRNSMSLWPSAREVAIPELTYCDDVDPAILKSTIDVRLSSQIANCPDRCAIGCRSGSSVEVAGCPRDDVDSFGSETQYYL